MMLTRRKPFSSFKRRTSSFGMTPKKKPSSGRYVFTLHSEYKMREYHLSRQRVIRVIRSPKRTEEGIVPDTVAVMQPSSTRRVNGKETWSQEIWVMYAVEGRKKKLTREEALLEQPKLRIISSWRYPGISPERDPIPAEILREIGDWNSMEVAE